MAASKSVVKLLKGISNELRRALPPGTKVQQNASMNFILGEYRKHEETSEQYCKHSQEMAFLADTYHTYLVAQRKWTEVQQEYHASGERSVRTASHMVGLNMPDEPKIEKRKPLDEV